jgi:hypothetical protein
MVVIVRFVRLGWVGGTVLSMPRHYWVLLIKWMKGWTNGFLFRNVFIYWKFASKIVQYIYGLFWERELQICFKFKCWIRFSSAFMSCWRAISRWLLCSLISRDFGPCVESTEDFVSAAATNANFESWRPFLNSRWCWWRRCLAFRAILWLFVESKLSSSANYWATALLSC